MVLWDEESVGTVQLRDLYQGVGSTATAASASRISRVWAQPTCDAVGAGLRRSRGGGGVVRNDTSASGVRVVLLKDICLIVQLRDDWLTDANHYQWKLT